ncbi:MAG: glycosyltransferase family 4 protein [Candidatus Liptonbacteria bacterium]|nr:glycosyltransferase family 4 protein [Candidatus Liptonbacteria bacterium]
MPSTKNTNPLFISRALPYLGGREVIVEELINHYSATGLSLITPDWRRKRRKVPTVDAEKPRTEILKWVKKQNIDVISCHTFYLAELAFFLARELKKPLVFTLHGVFIKYYGNKYKIFLRNIYKNSDRVITVCDGLKKELKSYLKDSSKLSTVKNGISLHSIDRLRGSKWYYRKKTGLPKSKFIVVTPARLNPIKGLEYLMRAAGKIGSKDVLFVVLSPKGRNVKEEVRYKKVLMKTSHNVRNVMFRTLSHLEVLEHYKAADLMMLPSLTEGISVSVLEAMASFLPVVTTRVGGNPEVIKSGENGFLIRSRNPSDIKKAIFRIKNGKDIPKIVEAARKTVVKNFSSDIMLMKYDRIFKEVIHENK